MNSICEIRVVKEGTEEDEEPVYETRKYILLHFGLRYQVIALDDDRQIAVNYTVAICQDYITGQLRCFAPEEIRIIGTLVK